MRFFALALLLAGCKSDPVVTYLDAEIVECVDVACPTEAGDADPCDAFDRPMVCVDAATVASSGIDIDGEAVGCDAVCWATCDAACDEGTQCREVGIENICVPEGCGNGFVDPGEACDDGNEDDTDDCLTTCEFTFCGDGELQGDEECDDGAGNGDDQACTSDCVIARCGDGLEGPDEACDDGNDVDDDDCRNDCSVPGCGDGELDEGEACDDGNDESGDGCSSGCDVEVGFDCTESGCECDEGYTGDACDACDVGYQDADLDGLCRPDCDLAAVFTPCEPDSETCAIVDGEATCECADGYELGDNVCEEIPPCRRYVTQDASGSGTSWDDASGDLQAMVDAVGALVAADPSVDCEVWVGEGTWTFGDLLRTETLTLAENVTVRGGFAATEEELDERTLNNDGRPVLGSILDGQGNAYHVVTAADGATLDGFTITGGLADQDSEVSDHGWGGGVFARGNVDVTLSGILFTGNEAERGGAIAFDAGGASVTDCAFEVNEAEYSGGAIDARGDATLDVIDVTFTDNTTSNGHGGAIYAADGVDLYVAGGSFFANVAQWDGSAIWSGDDGLVSLISSDFVNNGGLEQGCLGGAVFVDGESEGVEITDALFLGNASMMEGGAVYVLGAAELTLANSTFTDNISSFPGNKAEPSGGRGGAIVAYDIADIDFSGVQFSGNEAYWDGGAVYLDGVETLSMTTVTFAENTSAEANGAGLYATGVDDVTIDDGTFTDNLADDFGGAMYIADIDAAALSNLTVLNNTATTGLGGGLYLHVMNPSAPVTIEDVEFEANAAPRIGGAAIAAADMGSFALTNATVRSHGSEVGTGTVLVFESDTVTVTDSTFEDNDNYWAGALFVRGFGTLDVVGGSFTTNNSEFGSGLTACAGAADRGTFSDYDQCGDLGFVQTVTSTSRDHIVSVQGTTFTGNEAAAHWGAGAAVYDVAEASFDGVTFADHTGSDDETGDGSTGALYVNGVPNGITVANATFTNNDSGDYFSSGLYASDASSLTVTDSTFENSLNFAHIGVERITAVVVEGSTFTDAVSSANGIGGGIAFTRGTTLEVRDSAFERMSATVGGAGIWFDAEQDSVAPSVLIERTTFSELEAGTVGAAVSVSMTLTDDPGTVSILDSTFTDTEVGIVGGAVRAEYTGPVTIDGSSFRDNSAGINGGAVRIGGFNSNTGDVAITGSTFENSNAGTVGGALSIEKVDRLAVTDSTFVNGSAGIIGGAIRATTFDETTLTNLTFEGFSTDTVGGAIAMNGEDTSTATATNLVFEDNITGVTGGAAVFDDFVSVDILESHFEGNATGAVAGVGSALYTRAVTDLTVDQTAFIANTSGVGDDSTVGYTGALAIEQTVNLVVTNSLFARNLTENVASATSTGVSRGGAIYMVPDEDTTGSASITVVGSTFEGNTANDGGSAVAVWRGFGLASTSQTQMSVVNSIVTGNVGLNAIEHTTGLFEGDLGLADSAVQDLDIGLNNVFSDDPMLFGGEPTDVDIYRPWRLMPGSPALAAGTANGLSTEDLEGTVRGDPPDLGAFEAP